MTLTTFTALLLISVPVIYVAGLLILCCCEEFLDNLPGEVDMPPEEKPARPTVRFVTTLYGDSLVAGIRRAFILASEYDEVVLLHSGTPVVVTWDSDPYSIEAEWRQTRAIQNARRICNGK